MVPLRASPWRLEQCRTAACTGRLAEADMRMPVLTRRRADSLSAKAVTLPEPAHIELRHRRAHTPGAASARVGRRLGGWEQAPAEAAVLRYVQATDGWVEGGEGCAGTNS
eukprot:84920-Rhodomonas_salina.1